MTPLCDKNVSICNNVSYVSHKINLLYVISPRPLDSPGCLVLSLPYPRRGNDFQLFPRRELLLELDIHLFLKLPERISLFDMPQYMLNKGMEYI